MNVHAAFVTFNRREICLTCVRRLLGQTRPPERILVVDGGSGDGTVEALRENFGAEARLRLVQLPDNPGNAAGMAEAMRLAVEDDADAVWLLDDDSWPEPDALERLLAVARPQDREVAGSLVLTPGARELAWPIPVLEAEGKRHLVENIANLPLDRPSPVWGIWLGALVPAAAVREVGTPHPGLFIRGEDEEYPARLRQAGFRFTLVPDSVLEHPAPGRLRRFTLARRHFFHETRLAPWKSYYLLRNRVYCRRRFASSAVIGAAQAAATGVLGILLPLLLEDRKIERLGLHLRATADGFTGRLGKSVSPPTKT